MKNRKIKTFIGGLLIIAPFIFNSCQEEKVGVKEADLSKINEIEIGSDENVDLKPSGNAFLGVEGDAVQLAKASVWLYRRGGSPEGSIRLRLVRVSDNAKLLQSAAVDISQLTTSSTGSKITWTLDQGNGYEIQLDTRYRIEVIPSYSALIDYGQTQNQLVWLLASGNPYFLADAVGRVRNTTPVGWLTDMDFRLVTQNYDANGDLYTDLETTSGITSYNDYVINNTYPTATDGFIYGQEFYPLQ